MDTLVRSTTLRFSRRSAGGYGPLDQGEEDAGNDRKEFSKGIKNEQNGGLKTSFSFRRERAKKRQIFLRTYKLESLDSASGKSTCGQKLKKVAVKVVKSVVVSTVSFMRFNPLTTCRSPVICASCHS